MTLYLIIVAGALLIGIMIILVITVKGLYFVVRSIEDSIEDITLYTHMMNRRDWARFINELNYQRNEAIRRENYEAVSKIDIVLKQETEQFNSFYHE